MLSLNQPPNDLRYPLGVGGWTRRFAGTNFKPGKRSKNAARTPRRVHAVLAATYSLTNTGLARYCPCFSMKYSHTATRAPDSEPVLLILNALPPKETIVNKTK